MKITVAGTGYVGLVTGVSLAEIGHQVICFDINEQKVKELQAGRSPIYEPGLEEMLCSNMNGKRIYFTSNAEYAYKEADLIIIAVGTPENDDGSANLSYVRLVAEDIAKYSRQEEIIIVTKSTVPVGTNEKVKKWVDEESSKRFKKIHIVSNPEFLREGSALYDTFNGDRIVVGTDCKEVAMKMDELYGPLNIPIIHTDIESSEMIKYASNAFLATKISFINEIANICEKVGANIDDVSRGIGMDQRIGPKFLQAGVGYGGSCFPKDTKALVQLAGDVHHRFHLLEAVINVNNNQPLLLIQKAREIVGTFEHKKVAILGIAFKPNTDDIRESASLVLIKELINEGAIITVYDPIATYLAKQVLGENVLYSSSIDDAINDADITFIATEWKQVVNYPLNKYVSLMKDPIIIDGRNCYPLASIRKENITYVSVGRETLYREDKIVIK
ncbi:UDP-glucose/GDP-mannose dehydrogenase family protein [Metabacillus litoralis]|uniref:UDP-glucose 6-dehydrogenase n=1 Tax=Metabacillus litoralis TaxID=152268 RepID=A0A5C6W3K7_9BACI|nr:UDP-glucose/GDP-mannose dehydrogenase family protein [Metabacillus litoralis]TXC90942.1 UDP-glucose/GDP-mannose dehydrogenase family protein [Metabacillus litoralis]